MHTRFEVRTATGDLLGIFPGSVAEYAAEVRALIADHPDAEVRPVVTVDEPCKLHPSYEADNCPDCGTATTLRLRD